MVSALSALAENEIGEKTRHALFTVAIGGVVAHDAIVIMAHTTPSSLSRGHGRQPSNSLPSDLLGRTSPQQLAGAGDFSERAGQMEDRSERGEPHCLLYASAQARQAQPGQDNLGVVP
jgi:hypothetical protein